MRKVNKNCEPEFFTEFKKRSKPKEWKDALPVIPMLNSYILEREQGNYCPYCEKHIIYNEEDKTPPNPHIEHIWPQSRFPKKRFDYNNLVVSCTSKSGIQKQHRTCGVHKESEFDDELFINPISVDDPAKILTHNATGKITPFKNDPEDPDYKKATYTIEVLNLNELNLLGKRKTMHLNLSYLTGGSKDEFMEYLEEYTKENLDFPSIIQYHVDNYDVLYGGGTNA